MSQRAAILFPLIVKASRLDGKELHSLSAMSMAEQFADDLAEIPDRWLSAAYEHARIHRRPVPRAVDVVRSWEIVVSNDVSTLHAINAPIVARRVAAAIWDHEELVFEDETMGALCLGLGMGARFGFPTDYQLSMDQQIQSAYKAAKLADRKISRIIGFGNRKGSSIVVPSGDKYRGPRISCGNSPAVPLMLAGDSTR